MRRLAAFPLTKLLWTMIPFESNIKVNTCDLTWVTAFRRCSAGNVFSRLSKEKWSKARKFPRLNSASFKTAWRVNGEMHRHKHSQCEVTMDRKIATHFAFGTWFAEWWIKRNVLRNVKLSPTTGALLSCSAHLSDDIIGEGTNELWLLYCHTQTIIQCRNVVYWYKGETGGKRLWGEKGHTAVHWCPYKPYK